MSGSKLILCTISMRKHKILLSHGQFVLHVYFITKVHMKKVSLPICAFSVIYFFNDNIVQSFFRLFLISIKPRNSVLLLIRGECQSSN